MTFESQVKEAKSKKLQSRITRDIVFLALGVSFLIISILTAVNKDNKDVKKIKTTTKASIAEKN